MKFHWFTVPYGYHRSCRIFGHSWKVFDLATGKVSIAAKGLSEKKGTRSPMVCKIFFKRPFAGIAYIYIYLIFTHIKIHLLVTVGYAMYMMCNVMHSYSQWSQIRIKYQHQFQPQPQLKLDRQRLASGSTMSYPVKIGTVSPMCDIPDIPIASFYIP